MLLKLVGWFKSKLPYRMNRNESSPEAIPLLIVLSLQSKISSRHRSNICQRKLYVALCCQFNFAMELFRVRFCSHRLLLYYLVLLEIVLKMGFLLQFFSIEIFFPFYRSNSISCSFLLFVSFNRFFRKFSYKFCNIVYRSEKWFQFFTSCRCFML